LFSCGNWSRLHSDIDELGGDLVSLSMVPNPFGDYDETYLHECFDDLVIPFKQHFVADMHRPIGDIVSRHHQKYAEKALRKIRTEVCTDPEDFLDEWVDLHKNLVQRHNIQGIRAFSRSAFEQQLRAPGLVVLRALRGDETVGAQLWFQQDEVAIGHVLAFTDLGYSLGATYALLWFALNHFSGKVKWCDLGGVAGLQENQSNGLSKFKDGWSTGKITAHLCGKILNREKYDKLVALNQNPTGFFPAYRTVF